MSNEIDDFGSDDFNDFDTSDSYTDVETTESPVQKQDTAIDAIADLLMGNEKALDNVSDKESFGRSGTSVRDTDSTRDDNKSEAHWARQYDRNHQQFPSSPGDAAQQALQTQSQIHDAAKQLTERFEAGLVDQQTYYSTMTQLSYNNQQAQIEQLQAEKQAAQYQGHMAQAHQVMNERYGKEWSDPQQRQQLQRNATEYMMKNYSMDATIFSEIDDPRVAAAVIDLYKKDMAIKELTLSNKKLKAELKGRGIRLEKGRRDAEIGGRGKSGGTSEQIDEVVKVLFGGGK